MITLDSVLAKISMYKHLGFKPDFVMNDILDYLLMKDRKMLKEGNADTEFDPFSYRRNPLPMVSPNLLHSKLNVYEPVVENKK